MARAARPSFNAFLDACPGVEGDPRLSFPNVGQVTITTITKGNLEMLRRARMAGHPGIIVSCPDFARESLAVAFIGAFQHLLSDEGGNGLHEARAGEVVVVGDRVVKITKADDKVVMFTSDNRHFMGYLRERYEFPLVHTAKSGSRLTRMKSAATLQDEARRLEALPKLMKDLLDNCGKTVPAIGYVSSPSMYLEEPPTQVCKGSMRLGTDTAPLNRIIPISYISSSGKVQDKFERKFEACPSLMVAPRIDGVGSAAPIIEQIRSGSAFDFVAFNIPGPESLGTTLLGDILDLVDENVGVIGLCDRWTLDRMQPLVDEGFLLFDWDECQDALTAQNCVLSPVQQNIRDRGHERIVAVGEGDSGLSRAKSILYDNLEIVDFYSDEAMGAKQDLFSALSSAIRMTESPDYAYSNWMQETITSAVDAIEDSCQLSPEGFGELCEARDILLRAYRAGNVLPKQQAVYDLIKEELAAGKRVVLVVDRGKTDWVDEYWRKKIGIKRRRRRKADTTFRVISTRDFMSAKGLAGNESVIFSGWYDRGTMDRALHSGIVANMTLVLYDDGNEGLEIEWWKRAKSQWRKSSDRCAVQTNKTLPKLGIKRVSRPKKYRAGAASLSPSALGGERDDSPTSIITDIEKKRLQKDVAKKGEESVSAVPVMFEDGSHVWLRSKTGKMVVITDCLAGKGGKPERKPAKTILMGDVVLRTHSSKEYIRKAAEKRLDEYQDIREVAGRWKKPIEEARSAGLSDGEIISRIRKIAPDLNYGTVRSWVSGKTIAPMYPSYIRAIFDAFDEHIEDAAILEIIQASRQIRVQHQRTGVIAAEAMVEKFLKDVETYGLDDALVGFDDRHESGNVTLLKVSAVGEQMDVSLERADIL